MSGVDWSRCAGWGLLLLVLAGAPARADREPTWPAGDTAREEIERGRLDFHPRPSDLREAGVRVLGEIAYGYARLPGCAGSTLRLPSRIGIQGMETLDQGWTAHFRVEHQIDAPAGCTGALDRPAFWNRQVRVGLGWRRTVRVDFGRNDHPAAEVARRADPLDGTVTSLSHFLYPGPAGLGPLDRQRANGSLTLRHLAPEGGLGGAVQVTAGAREADDDLTRTGGGASIDYRFGPFHVGAGWQRWGRALDSELAPVFVRWQLDHRLLVFGATFGTLDDRRYRALAASIESRQVRGPMPPTWRASIAWGQREGRPGEQQVGGGFSQPLSARTEWNALAALRRTDGRTTQAIELGLRHRLSW